MSKHRATGRPYPMRYEVMYYKQLWWTKARPAMRSLIKKIMYKKNK